MIPHRRGLIPGPTVHPLTLYMVCCVSSSFLCNAIFIQYMKVCNRNKNGTLTWSIKAVTLCISLWYEVICV